MTIIIADELPVVRAGLKVIVESGHAGEVVGEAGDGLEALCLVEKCRPAMLITNLKLTRLSGLELTRQVHRLYVDTKVIVISHWVNSTDLTSIFHHGAHGFMNLNSSAADIQKAIYEVNAGKRHLAPTGVEAILTSMSNGGSATAEDDAYEKLTVREREILQLAAGGLDRKAIASRLFISQRTVETHRAHIMQKLQLHSQTDLVRFAIRKGIMEA
ncbi:MAG TPA: response regulator transcription factor [Verrucomicrobiae bacterium]|nr:response regulator transcription factor [Verrucomicrobiae bacterium]